MSERTIEQLQAAVAEQAKQIKLQHEALYKIAGYLNRWLGAEDCRNIARAALQAKEGK